ncbi:hypothetical protein IT882_04375 [Microbacterium schleiferi]|uniref:Uncharacterized protein n=1 Tax=Microbacterium schleiferi TaxID=69362 RepID=A0A7S8MZM8_9MICO|nr:hypothetical protein [Microbacterium schleiferi]QPE05310.1 hypothetical protein IT882_04375 [Microbacterium schleiferi]
MAGSRTSTGFYVLKKALFDAAVSVFQTSAPEFEQNWGRAIRARGQWANWVGGDTDQQPGPFAPTKPRDETLRVQVEFWAVRSGPIGAAREAEEYLYDRVGELEEYVRENTTLGGVARHCFLSRIEVDTLSYQAKDTTGYTAGVGLEFEGRVRITG